MDIQIHQLPCLPIQRKSELPKISAIYFFLSGSQVLYVGKTNSLRRRFLLHHKTIRAKQEYSDIVIAWMECEPKILSQTEKYFIGKLNPPLNIQKHNNTRGDSHALINITLSVSSQEKMVLENIALHFGQTWGDDPNISKLMRAIADGQLKVCWGDDSEALAGTPASESPMTNQQRSSMKAAIAMIQEGLSKLIRVI